VGLLSDSVLSLRKGYAVGVLSGCEAEPGPPHGTG
jgi:hypothetical protein